MPRAVLCLVCNKIERMTDPPAEVPLVPAVMKWYEDGKERSYTMTDPETGMTSMVPMHDPLLEDFVGRHQHGLADTDIDSIKVWSVDQETWDSMDVIDNIKRELQENQNIIVEESNYYKDEATKCYNRHGNPDVKKGCPDFLDEHMRIGSGKVHPKARVYLCHMCPYMQTYVMQEVRGKAGLYDKPEQAAKKARAREAKLRAGKAKAKKLRRQQKKG
jgi:hypothetical protein